MRDQESSPLTRCGVLLPRSPRGFGGIGNKASPDVAREQCQRDRLPCPNIGVERNEERECHARDSRGDQVKRPWLIADEKPRHSHSIVPGGLLV